MGMAWLPANFSYQLSESDLGCRLSDLGCRLSDIDYRTLTYSTTSFLLLHRKKLKSHNGSHGYRTSKYLPTLGLKAHNSSIKAPRAYSPSNESHPPGGRKSLNADWCHCR